MTVFARVPADVHAWLEREARVEAERQGSEYPSIGRVVRLLLVKAHRSSKRPNGKKGAR